MLLEWGIDHYNYLFKIVLKVRSRVDHRYIVYSENCFVVAFVKSVVLVVVLTCKSAAKPI